MNSEKEQKIKELDNTIEKTISCIDYHFVSSNELVTILIALERFRIELTGISYVNSESFKNLQELQWIKDVLCQTK